MTLVVVHFHDIPSGPPIAWVPPHVHGICVPVLAGGTVDWAHIPQERGGAPGGVVACSWEGAELARAKVVVVR